MHNRRAARHFNALHRNILKPRHQPKRHGLRRLIPGAEQQQRCAGIRTDAAIHVHGLLFFHAAFGGNASAARNTIRIQDHDDAAITQNGIAAEHGDVAQNGCHRLHHDFFRIKHAVHHNAKDIGAHLHHNNITFEATHRRLTQPQQ